MHLSRLAEELVIWASSHFGFIAFSDAFSTGSSMMPQKRNPDAAELVRGKTGRIFGGLLSLLTVMKGLPLTYSKDMQEDKEAVFGVFDTLELCLAATTGMINDIRPERERMRAQRRLRLHDRDRPCRLDRARTQYPFPRCPPHDGRIVALAESRGCGLADLSLADMRTVEPRITQDVFSVLSVEASAASRTSYGGTAPENVHAQVKAARERF